MSTRQKKKEKTKSCICPICRTTYPTQSLADNCSRTKRCVEYNSPDAERRHAFVLHSLTASLGYCIFMPIADEVRNAEVRDSAERAVKNISSIFVRIRLFFVNIRFAEKRQSDLVMRFSSFYDTGEPVDCLHLLYAYREILRDLMRAESEHADGFPGIPEWREVADATESIIHFYNPDDREDFLLADQVQNRIELFREMIGLVPPEDIRTRKELKLYLLNNRFWIAATSRDEARRILLKEHSLKTDSLTGINSNEILGNGMTAQAFISQTETPCLLGRTY